MNVKKENKVSVVVAVKEKLKIFWNEAFRVPFHLITHPIAGWNDFKTDKKGKLWVAMLYFVLMIITIIIQKTSVGFLYDPMAGKDFNLIATVSLVVLPIIVLTVGNWCITSLFDGKGKMIEIFYVICYSLFPYVWLGLIASILSHVVVTDEMVYVHFIFSAGALLLGYMLFFGLRGIHEYGLIQNILTILFTIVAMAIIIFMTLLLLSFIQQITNWLLSIYNEIKMRYF